jgi:aspartate/methionine/tyrosine aminotransferase
MKINDFKLERYFAAYEFRAKRLLSSSDCESLTINELLHMADTECLELWHHLKVGYTESKGHPLLRDEIAGLYRNIKSDDVCVMAPEEGIFIALNVILDPGDHVIVTDPGYQSLAEIPESIGCEVTRWPLAAEGRRWKLDTDFLLKSVRKNTKLIVINFPHNPTGFIPEPDEFKRITEIALENNVLLFSDEMYRYLEFPGSARHDSACDISDSWISLSGLSKSFGLPGLRIGWLATRNRDVMRRIERFKDYTTICNSALSEIFGIIALRNRERITGNNLKLVQANLQAAKLFFRRHEDLLTWIEPGGGSVAFPALSRGIAADELCKRLIDQKSIMLLPGSVFNYPGNHIRIGLGRKDFSTILDEFEYFLNEYYFTI